MVKHKLAGGETGGISSSRLIWAAHQEPFGRIKERKKGNREGEEKKRRNPTLYIVIGFLLLNF